MAEDTGQGIEEAIVEERDCVEGCLVDVPHGECMETGDEGVEIVEEVDESAPHVHTNPDGSTYSHEHVADGTVGLSTSVEIRLSIADEASVEFIMGLRDDIVAARTALQLAQDDYEDRNLLSLATRITFVADEQALTAALATIDKILLSRGVIGIEMEPVESSNIEAIGFRVIVEGDPTQGDVLVQFQGGAIYAYLGVPRIVYDALMEADSKGGFLNAEIKPVFAFQKVTS